MALMIHITPVYDLEDEEEDEDDKDGVGRFVGHPDVLFLLARSTALVLETQGGTFVHELLEVH